jgi:hypothetical protein
MTQKMTSMQGVFYPTGYVFLMFPDAQTAEQAGQALAAAGLDTQEAMLLTPQVILQEIGKLDERSNVMLPSVGTEGATVGKYIALAREGHHALMLKSPSDEDTERVMSAVRNLPFSYAQKYHMLAIEDLE